MALTLLRLVPLAGVAGALHVARSVSAGVDGFRVVRDFREAGRSLCGARGRAGASFLAGAPSAAAEPAVVHYGTPSQEGCEAAPGRTGRISVLPSATLGFSSLVSMTALSVPCRELGGQGSLGEYIQGYDIGDAALLAADGAPGAGSACTAVREDTILVVNPRQEYFNSVYHNMEEVFSMLETADVLQRPLSDFRVLFVYDRYSSQASADLKLVQLDGQLQPRAAPGGNASEASRTLASAGAIPQLLDMWSHLFVRRDAERLPRLPDAVPKAAGLCFTGRVVLPMRACTGEILTRTWAADRSVRVENPLAMQYAQRVARAMGLRNKDAPTRTPTARPRVLLLVRKNAQNGRDMHPSDKEELTHLLKSKLNAEVDEVDFAQLSYRDQIRHAQENDLMISTHGAGMTHLMFMLRGSAVIEITDHPPPTPGFAKENIYMNLAAWTGQGYRPVLGIKEGRTMRFRPSAILSAAEALLSRSQ